MKYILALVLLLSLAVATPALAFTSPAQGTDNATDVILWHGDNITIESGNITITSANLTGSVGLTGEVEVTGLTDTLSDIADDYLALLVVAFFIGVVLLKQSTVLNALGVPVAFVYGLSLASGEDTYSTLWVAGVAIAIVGLYFLYQIAADVVAKIRGQE